MYQANYPIIFFIVMCMSRQFLSLTENKNGHCPEFKREVTDLSHYLQRTDPSEKIPRNDQLTRKTTSRLKNETLNLYRKSVDLTKDILNVGYCNVLCRNVWILLTNLSLSCRAVLWKLYFSVRNVFVFLLLGIKYFIEKDFKSNFTFISLPFFLLTFLLSGFFYNFGNLKSCVNTQIYFRQRGLSKHHQIFIPKLHRIKEKDIKHVQIESIYNTYSSYKTLYSRKNAFSYIPVPFKYSVYPVSIVNLLASYRPLVYMEMPNSIFFITLSSNGFFYPGSGASVSCIGCENVVELVRFVSEPSREIYHKPGCEFIKVIDGGEATSNSIPTGAGSLSQPLQYQAGNDRQPSQYQSMNESSSSASSLVSNNHSTPPGSHLTQTPAPAFTPSLTSPTLGPGPPAYPIYSSVTKRTESFVGWTKNSIVTSTDLVQAGFFYAGYSDCVRCFQCGLGLRSWKPGDDIYVEHQRFRPTCVHLQTLLRNKPQGRADNAAPSAESSVNSNNGQTRLGAHNAHNGTSQVCSISSSNSLPGSIGTSVIISNGQHGPESNIAHSLGQEAHSQIVISSSLDLNREGHQLSTTSPSGSGSTSDVVASLLQRENQVLKEQMKCKSCKTSPVQDLFLPCGEMYTCKDCSNKFTHCPSCGKRILGTVTVFFA